MVVLMLAKLLLNLLVSKVGALQYGLIVRLQGKQCLTVLWAGGAGRYLIQINLPLRIELHHIRPVVTGSGIHHLDPFPLRECELFRHDQTVLGLAFHTEFAQPAIQSRDRYPWGRPARPGDVLRQHRGNPPLRWIDQIRPSC